MAGAGALWVSLYSRRPSYSEVVLEDKPAGYWRLAEVAGTTAMDRGTNLLDGTYNGPVKLGVTGPLLDDAGAAARFLTTAEFVRVNHDPRLNITSPYALEIWLRTTGTSPYNNPVVTEKGLNQILLFQPFANTHWWGGHTTSPQYFTSFYADGNWHMWFVNFSPPPPVIYGFQDTVPAGTINRGALGGNTDNLTIGERDPSVGGNVDAFNGDLAEFAVFDYPVSTGRMEAHFRAASRECAPGDYWAS